MNGCSSNAVATIGEPLPLSISFVSQKNVSCNGGSDGGVGASVSGGTANYSYSWMPGGFTTAQVNNISAGTYTLTVLDSKGCSVLNTVTITEPISPLAVSLSGTNVSCYGGNDGSITPAVTGGTSPYNYLWTPVNVTTASISNIFSGTYTLKVTDTLGCTTTNSLTITQPNPMLLTTNATNSDCGQPNGKTSVSVVGGTGPYSYLWLPTGGTNDTATGLVSGAYNVIVTDATGCSASQWGNVNENSAPSVSIFSTINVSCFGGSDGSITAVSSGGIGPYTYSWAPTGGTDSIATGLMAGSYTVTITGGNGCQSLATTSPDLTQPDSLFINISQTPASCFGSSTGSASATITGGTGGYSYLWMPGNNTTSSIANLVSGTYTLQVTDGNTCIAMESILVQQPTNAISSSVTFTPTSCNNGNDGTATAIASGGTSPYNYLWTTINVQGAHVEQLSATNYYVTITDANGCSTTDSITITEPTAISTTVSSINSNCSLANGQATVNALGGTPTYSYLWSGTGATNLTVTGLLSGSYTVTVTDNNGCTVNDTIIVNDNQSPSGVISTTTNISCYGLTDGMASVTVSGNAAPYSYLWMPSGETTATATQLGTGTHTVIVTDANNCQSQSIITPEITQPDPIYISINASNVLCFGNSNGSASATITGGTAGYSYLWMPGNNTTSSITNLVSGTYTLQVTDGNTCIATESITIQQPDTINSIIQSITPVNCFGESTGTATVFVNGGTEPYSYSWLPLGGNGLVANGLSAGNYTVTITDINGCTTVSDTTITEPTTELTATTNLSNVTCYGLNDGAIQVIVNGGTAGYTYQWNPSVASTSTANNLAPDNYFITVTDINGCQTVTSATLIEPPAISGTLITTNPTCSLLNGSIESSVSGGVSPYTYYWQQNAATTYSINNLGAGVYNLTITDATNCALPLSANLTVEYYQLLTNVIKNDVSCFGGNDGAATLNVTQGAAPFTISWMPYGGSNFTATSLDTGIYVVDVTDSKGCEAKDTIIISEPPVIDVSVNSLTNVLCNGGSSGAIELAVSGGTGVNYSYAWAPSVSTSNIASSLSIGVYSVVVSDQNNCSKNISVLITEPAPLSVSTDSVKNPLCSTTYGSASISASGGTLPYNYVWSYPAENETGNFSNNLIASNYTVTVTDSNGCISSTSFSLISPSSVITTAGLNDTICLGQSTTITATASGGSSNYTYAWQPSGAINTGALTVTPSMATTYTVIAYDQNGCPGVEDTIRVVPYSLTGVNINAAGNTPICPGQSTYIYAETSGDTGPLTFQWNNNIGNGAGAHQVIPSAPTVYTVGVTNSCGTTVYDSIQILFNPPPIIDFTSTPNSACTYALFQFNDNSIPANANDSIITWSWQFGDGNTSTLENPIHSFTTPGNYFITLTVTTSLGCTNTNTSTPFVITAYPSPVAAFSMNSNYFMLPNDVMQLTNLSTGANSYFWDFGDGTTSTLLNPSYLYNAIGIFNVQLIAINQYGCTDSATAVITTDADIIFPNAFTPNPYGPSGGVYDINSFDNDIFFPYTSGVVEYELQIFNRWGELIFESFDVKNGWDGYYRGQLCQQDVYVWKAYVRLSNGKVFNKVGDLTLIE
ncbi:MAG: PKD domain-containing protein [Bacteroidia bacterium]